MSSGDYLHGQFTSVGPSRRRGGCVEAEYITVSDVTLHNVLISKEAFDLLELGEVVELVYYQHANTTYLTYLRYNGDKLSPLPNFASRTMSKLGFRALGCTILGTFILLSMFPDLAIEGGYTTFLIPVTFGASVLLAAIGYVTTMKKVLSTKKLFP